MTPHTPLWQQRNKGDALRAEHPDDPGGNADQHTVGQQAARKGSHFRGRMPRDVTHYPRARA